MGMSAEAAIKEGYKCFCLQCNKAYKKTPSYWDESVSCMGGEIEMCKCGCDLFMSFEQFIQRRDGTYVEPEDPNAPIESRLDILDL